MGINILKSEIKKAIDKMSEEDLEKMLDYLKHQQIVKSGIDINAFYDRLIQEKSEVLKKLAE